jgi:hypothetical protein
MYKVKRVASKELPGKLGKHDSNTFEIVLRKSLRRDKSRECLLHEILHACHYAKGADTQRTDEEWIEATVHTLLEVLTDNPEVVEYLTTRKLGEK